MTTDGLPFELKTLGTVDLRLPTGKSLVRLLRQDKRMALLVFLACRDPGGRVRRDTLLAVFWPESDHARARNSLNQALHFLRKELGVDVLSADGDSVWVDPDRLSCDARAFREAVAEHRYEAALEIYRGAFLEGFHLSGAPDFDAWSDARRSEFARIAADACWCSAARAEAGGELHVAVAMARRAVAMAPLEEKATQRLMALLAGAGDSAAAVQAFEELERRLADELDVDPSPETLAAARALRSGADPDTLRTPLQELGAPPEPPSPAGLDAALEQADGPAARDPAPRGFGRIVRSGTRPRARWLVGGAVAAAIGAGWWGLRLLQPTLPVQAGTVVFRTEEGAEARDLLAEVQDRITRSGVAKVVAAAGSGGGPAVGLEELRARGSEAAGVLSRSASGAFTFRLVESRSGHNLVTLALDAQLPDSAAADLIAGAVALHLDRSLADWGDASSVVPTLGAWLAFKESLVAWRDGRNKDSMDALERAVGLQPWFPLVILELAQARQDTPAGPDSLLAVLSARRSELTEVERLHLSSLEDEAAHRLDREYTSLKRLAELVPERYAGSAAERAVSIGDYDAAVRLADLVPLQRALPPLPDFAKVGSRHALGRHEEELRVAGEMKEIFPERRWYFNYEVAALAALGRVEEIERVLAEREAFPAPQYGPLGSLNVRAHAVTELLAHGWPEEARSVAAEGVRQVEAKPDLHLYGADLYLAVGDLDRAEEIEVQRVEEGQEWPSVYQDAATLGVIAAMRGDREAALEWDRRVVTWPGTEAQKAHPRRFLARARIYARLGDKETAVSLLGRALSAGLNRIALRGAGPDLVLLRGDPGFDALLPDPTF